MMRNLPRECPSCGTIGEVAFGEHSRGDWPSGISWWEAFSCGACGESYELDDSGPLPAEYRQLEMKVGGVWGLFLTDFEAPTLAGLRKVTGLTLEEVRRIKDEKLNPVIIGTQTEVRRIVARLASVEVSAAFQRSSSDDSIDAAVLSSRFQQQG